MSDLYGMPGHLFRRVHQISSAIFAEECGAYGLTSVQFLNAQQHDSGLIFPATDANDVA